LAKINLVVGDYFKSESDLLRVADMATELIAWLRSKSLVLALLRETQENAGARVLAVIRAILTRWTAHYLSFRRLLEIRPSLTSIVYSDESRRESNIITGKGPAKAKAREMVELIKNTEFWKGLIRQVSKTH
jgi:hypothetical protein